MLLIDQNDILFKQYVKHVLSWEGLTSRDPRDNAASCAPFAGAYHTNKGVTFCTFRKLSNTLGITPASYERFLKLTNDDISAFVFYFCKDARANTLQDSVALSITEAAWGSGPVQATKHLQTVLKKTGFNKLAIDGVAGKETLKAALSIPERELFALYWAERQRFIANLVQQPRFAMYKNGWNNRINAFLRQFTP